MPEDRPSTAIALTGAMVVTRLDPIEVIDAALTIRDGRIVSISATGVGAATERGAERSAEAPVRRDCSGCVIVPGNVCGHTHLYSALARGMPYTLDPPDDFVQILRRLWWRLDRALDEESIRASALVGGMDALLRGTTTLIDHHASPNWIDGSLDVLSAALEELGIRSVLCYETTDRDGPERASAGVHENERFVSRAAPSPLTRAMVGAHASFTLSEETLTGCVDVARRAGVGIHIHAAEDGGDQRDCAARFGVRVAERLANAGALTEDTLLAHCIHLDANEAALIRDAGCAVAHNPTSNMNNAVGHADVLALGDRVLFGTDGIGADMFAESKSAYFRARDGDVHFPFGWPLQRMAEGGARAARIFGEPLLGALREGAPADLVVLDAAPPTPLDADNLGGHWSFGFDSRSVRDVLVAGRFVVLDRRLTLADQDEVAARARVAAGAMWERYQRIGEHPFEPEGGA
jgi:putative selenium metabolism protein SsnA